MSFDIIKLRKITFFGITWEFEFIDVILYLGFRIRTSGQFINTLNVYIKFQMRLRLYHVFKDYFCFT